MRLTETNDQRTVLKLNLILYALVLQEFRVEIVPIYSRQQITILPARSQQKPLPAKVIVLLEAVKGKNKEKVSCPRQKFTTTKEKNTAKSEL